MTGLDTNILVRHITQDDPVQSPIATEFIELSLTEENPGFVSLVALAELAWVLRSNYGWEAERVSQALRVLLLTESILVQNQDEVFSAITAVEMGMGTFEDALISALGQWADCSTTHTFDTKATRLHGMTFLTSI
jgi:predicted nucleic-acid-binding protein